ncbi:DUF2460 domain-containing protein [Variovorax sp. GT1P44]|uniref:DUF2460 domain-containing protein n=1 Tax=Variovorax sp. GT1P44 TaxID=3443742 RepID=UPI003F48A84C
MTFINQRLTSQVERGFKGGPQWNTLITPMAGDTEARNAEWSMPHMKFEADYTVMNPTQQNEVRTAFMSLRGRRDSMRFKDWSDYLCADEALGTGDGTTTPRQLRKYYTFGSATLARDILLPIAATVVVKANGVPITVTANDQTGMLTPSSAWPSGQALTVSCQFDVRVRFGQDYYPFTLPDQRIATVSIDLVEAITP